MIEKQWLIDCFRISKGQGDSRLALVLKTDDYISLYTAEPIKFVEPTNSKNFSTSIAALRTYQCCL